MNATTNRSKAKVNRGFTLVEMLVVIGMIASLAAISFPVYRSIQQKVERQQLEMDMGALERAVENFETEYTYLPYVGSSYPTGDGKYSSGDIVSFTSVLAGFATGGNTANFKQIKFFEAREAKGGPGNYSDGTVTTATTCTYYLPWGATFDVIKMDHNLDGEIKFGFGIGQIPTSLKWTYQEMGADGVYFTDDDYTNFNDLLP